MWACPWPHRLLVLWIGSRLNFLNMAKLTYLSPLTWSYNVINISLYQEVGSMSLLGRGLWLPGPRMCSGRDVWLLKLSHEKDTASAFCLAFMLHPTHRHTQTHTRKNLRWKIKKIKRKGCNSRGKRTNQLISEERWHATKLVFSLSVGLSLKWVRRPGTIHSARCLRGWPTWDLTGEGSWRLRE